MQNRFFFCPFLVKIKTVTVDAEEKREGRVSWMSCVTLHSRGNGTVCMYCGLYLAGCGISVMRMLQLTELRVWCIGEGGFIQQMLKEVFLWR